MLNDRVTAIDLVLQDDARSFKSLTFVGNFKGITVTAREWKEIRKRK